jgi:FMN-dependent NADH-azoreductase
MKQILVVKVSPRGAESASRTITERLTTRLHARYPDAKIVDRDLVLDLPPHLDAITVKAVSTKDPAEAVRLKASASLSDKLIEELLASDLLVISTPMWNFGIPSHLKVWIDLVVRPGKTFNYTETGVLGLAKGKKAILVVASGGVYTEGPWESWDFVDPYLRRILGFIGIDHVQTIRVEGMNIPPLAQVAIPTAEKAVEQLVL